MRQGQRHHDHDPKTTANSIKTKNHGPLLIVIMIKDTKSKTQRQRHLVHGPWSFVILFWVGGKKIGGVSPPLG